MVKRSFKWAVPMVLGAALISWFSAASLTAGPVQVETAKTVWDGVYSEDQARRGATAYAASCSSCHRVDLSGFNGALQGARFMDRWREDNLDSLFTNIKTTMPRDKPDSLSAETYLDILTYILEQNSFPTGATALGPDALKNIQVVAKGGAEPLPAGALAQTYGCVTEGPDNTWLLSSATAFVRTRNPDKSSDDDLKAAGAAPAGSQTYKLIDAAFYHPERHKDHKVEAKGFLVKEPGDGMSLTSLTMISATCP